MTTTSMTTLNIRNIDEQAVERAKRAAGVRGLTLGQYVARLVDLHDAMRALADTPSGQWEQAQVGVELEALGLGTVRA